MGERSNKKMAKIWRKEARAEACRELQLLNQMMKPRPKYFPIWLWRLLAKLFFKVPVV